MKLSVSVCTHSSAGYYICALIVLHGVVHNSSKMLC